MSKPKPLSHRHTHTEDDADEATVKSQADNIVRQTLDALERSLAAKRQTREKTQNFIGALRDAKHA